MKIYKVWIDQVNQQCLEVKAMTEKGAVGKARREWFKDNYPIVRVVEEQK